MKDRFTSFCVNFLLCILGICCALVLWLFICPKNDYLDHVNDIIAPYVFYNNVGMHCQFNEEYCDYLIESKRIPYFGSIPSDQTPIEITVFTVAKINIYPNDDSSVILVYDPISNLKTKRNYLITGCFADHLNYLHRITNNEIFMASITYPND